MGCYSLKEILWIYYYYYCTDFFIANIFVNIFANIFVNFDAHNAAVAVYNEAFIILDRQFILLY